MFDEKTILARLQNGEDAQTIANEMAAMINAANKMYAEEIAKAEEAKRAEEQKKALNAVAYWKPSQVRSSVTTLRSTTFLVVTLPFLSYQRASPFAGFTPA